MSRSFKEQTDRKLGWLAAGLLFFLLSSSAWALDLDCSIAAQDADSSKIAQTLGRHQVANQHTSSATKRKVRVTLFKKKKIKYASRLKPRGNAG